MTLSTENNSLPCVNSDMAHCSGIDVYLDGNCKDVVINLGQNLFANIYPVKFLFLEEQENCRKQPYNEEILKGINGKINESGNYPLRKERQNQVQIHVPVHTSCRVYILCLHTYCFHRTS